MILGPLSALLMLRAEPPDGLSVQAWQVAAIAVWMALWWMSEAVAIPITSLLPLILFPLFGVADIKSVAAPYANPIIYLFLGGFILALGIERWNLHRRIALTTLRRFGADARRLIAGFMLTAMLLSMWITNTATTIMLLPIALAVIKVIGDNEARGDGAALDDFSTAMLLGIAYAATLGGLATLIGTIPNALFAAFMVEHHDVQIGFAQWMAFGLPLTLILTPLFWWILTHWLFPIRIRASAETMRKLQHMRDELGPIDIAQKRVIAVFALTALAWTTRPLLQKIPALEALGDPAIALLAALSLFVLPSGMKPGQRLMDWSQTEKLPWGILLLFGGGLTLAAAALNTGLAAWLGAQLEALRALHPALLLLCAAAMIVFLTELTSNTGVTATFLPIMAALAGADSALLLPLMLTATIAASCAFMLPVATPPNAIVYASGRLRISQMARAGLALNLISILVITAAALWLLPLIFTP